jgi:hypothetical protein
MPRCLSVQDLIHALRLLPTGNNNSEEDVDMANLHSEDQHELDRESQVQNYRKNGIGILFTLLQYPSIEILFCRHQRSGSVGF